MESQEAVTGAELRKDPNPAAVADDTARPPTETTLRTVEVESNRAGLQDSVTKSPKKKKKTPKGRKTRVAKQSLSTDTSDSAASDDDRSDAGDSDSSDEDSDEDSDDGAKKSRSKKQARASKRKSKEKAKARKSQSSRRPVKPVVASDSDLSDSSETTNDSEEDVPPEESSTLGQQIQNLQLQFSQLQQQLTQQRPMAPAAGYPVPGGFPGARAMGMPGGFPSSGFPGAGLSSGFPPVFPSGFPSAAPLDLGANPLPESDPIVGRSAVGRRGGHRGGRRGLARQDSLGAKEPEPSNSDSRPKHKKHKKGTKVDFKRVDWIWDNSLYTFKLQDTAEPAPDSQYDEYIFHVRRTFDCDGKYRSTVVDIKSKLLRECLQDVIGNVKGISLVDETPKTDPNLLFLYLEDFRTHRKHLKQVQPAGETKKERRRNQRRLDTKRKHLRVLINYLDKDYAKTKESLYPMLENGLITFDLLWALWKPNTLAFGTTYGSTEEPRAFKVELAERQNSLMKGEFYYIDGKYFEFDGKKFGYGNLSEEVLEFRGARKITSLPCYPLKYHRDEEQLRKDLIERGRKFVALSGVHYKSYSGMAYLKRKKAVVKFNIQHSRIMVDPAIFRRINPNYYVSTVRPKDHDLLSDGGFSDDSDNCDSSDDAPMGDPGIKYVTKMYRTDDGNIRMARVPKDEAGGNGEKLDALAQTDADAPEGEPEFTDEEYLTASPTLLGFAFSEKQWLEFTVSGVGEIKWNDHAWDSLVLEPATKDLIQALVKSRKYSAAQTIDDVIQGKGKGLVTVLHGPPGTGKTLTAEGISELLKCPLYMASAGELGTDSRFLEVELQKILDICHAWGAILLLDEADVFLEKRNMHDIHRNALVSIFLRQLEYFQGILFLTTNRVETFDEAFQSRIHIALRYDALDTKAKKAIFKMFLERVRALGKLELEAFGDDDLNVLAKKELNGREIKNVVGSAQDLAVNKNEPLSMKHIKQVLDVHAKFGRDLKGGTGYEDAMRSYF